MFRFYLNKYIHVFDKCALCSMKLMRMNLKNHHYQYFGTVLEFVNNPSYGG
jgi:hypothetical protein